MRSAISAGLLAICLASAAHAANADHPYSNVNPQNDAGNDTGDSRVDALNQAQLNGGYRVRPRSPSGPGYGIPGYGAADSRASYAAPGYGYAPPGYGAAPPAYARPYYPQAYPYPPSYPYPPPYYRPPVYAAPAYAPPPGYYPPY